jgi:hypothetical protein
MLFSFSQFGVREVCEIIEVAKRAKQPMNVAIYRDGKSYLTSGQRSRPVPP